MNLITAGEEALLALIAPIDREVTELETRLNALKGSKAPIQAALKALRSTKKSKKTKPSPKQEDVREICLALVASNPGIKKTELEELVKHKLTEELGFDLKGFARRRNEVFNSDTFSIATDGTVSLASKLLDFNESSRDVVMQTIKT